MALLHRFKRPRLRLGDPVPAPRTPRSPAPYAPASLVLLIVLGMGIFWLFAASAQALPAVPVTIPGGLTTTTVFTLGQEAQTQVDALTVQAQAVQAQLAALDTQLDQKIDEYYQCLTDLDAAGDRLIQLRGEVGDAQAKKAQAQAALAQRIKAVYMSGGRDQLLQLLLLADNLQDLYNRARLVSTLADQDKRIVSGLQDSSANLTLLMNAVDGQRRQELALRSQLSQRTAEIQGDMTQKQQILAGLDAGVKAIIEQERQRQLAEQARIQAELQAKLLAAQQAALAAAQSQIHPRGSHVLSPGQIAYVAQQAGFKGHDLTMAVAVALAESGGNAYAEGDVTIGGSFGLWQVFCKAHPDLIPPDNPDSVAWYDPYLNARFAYQISGGSNWYPWSTYKHGTYLAFMDEARAAVVLLITDPSSLAP
jgi:peptidoglycan hydrolase CwlO-like protein